MIEQGGEEVGRVPIEDLGVLILDSYGITYTQELLIVCAESNVAVIICDAKHTPTAMFLPFESNSLHTKTLREQIECSEPKKKRVWQQIVAAKIAAQARLVSTRSVRDGAKLKALVTKVRSGDPDNLEAQAAWLYFESLFGDGFVRERNEPGINALLNYGYAILRACVARALVGTGLNCALGVFHSNQYNAFGLADVAMEPLRPLVDAHVLQWATDHPEELGLNPATKRALLEFTGFAVTFAGKKLPLTVCLPLYAASLKRAICGEDRKLQIPEV